MFIAAKLISLVELGLLKCAEKKEKNIEIGSKI